MIAIGEMVCKCGSAAGFSQVAAMSRSTKATIFERVRTRPYHQPFVVSSRSVASTKFNLILSGWRQIRSGEECAACVLWAYGGQYSIESIEWPSDVEGR